MPVILDPDNMQTDVSGEGWVKTTLADNDSIGTSAIAAYRWSFDPLASGPEIKHGNTDQLMYVISGSGNAQVNDEMLALDREAVLWLEPGDVYQFTAGKDGLEILQGYAPGV